MDKRARALVRDYVCVSDFEQPALARLPRNAREFYRHGADDELTVSENEAAFRRWIIRPRVLRDVSSRSLVTTVLGKPVPFPVGVAPTAMHKLCHPEGELAAVRAAAGVGAIFVLSTLSTCSIEEVATAAPGARLWFQLYVYNRDYTVDLIRRAEMAGFEALVVTVDSPMLGKRRPGERNPFLLPGHLKFANFDTRTKEESDALFKTKETTLTWESVRWLQSITRLPIVLKGILTAEDAHLAVEHGVAALFVSNHGGRQLDTGAGAIDVLEEVVHATRGRCEVYMDGGVRNGSDVFKAIALGARMVFVGRPSLWGLTLGGEEGAKRVLQILVEEFDLVMSLAGVASVGEIGRNFVERRSLL